MSYKDTDKMKAELNDFSNTIVAEAEEELRNKFKKHMKVAREFKEAGNKQEIINNTSGYN